MKIAIPVDNSTLNGEVSVSFGRASYFLIYDLETNESEFVLNKAANSQGGAGIKAAQQIVDLGARALITPRLGENAADIILKAGIKIKKALALSVENNIQAFANNELNDLIDIHAGFHGHH
jgi:predicted Fe-Mo cluster-binding NifX family protein